MTKLPKFEKSSGNVFADLGLPNADELLLKAQLTLKIKRTKKVANVPAVSGNGGEVSG